MSSPAITVYVTSWCPFCHRLRTGLDREGIEYRAVDIEREPAAADVVTAHNGGNRTVPTVVFADGSALTNPDVSEVAARLGGAPV